MTSLTQALVRELLDYDPETGKLYWRPRAEKWFKTAKAAKLWNAKHAGKEAFTAKNTDGKYHGKVFGRMYLAARIIYLHVEGWLPPQVDHRDRDGTNNRWGNLRAATQTVNMKNKSRYKSNTSGVPGVTYRPDTEKWRARINVDGRRKALGQFDTFEEAVAARTAAKEKYGYEGD